MSNRRNFVPFDPRYFEKLRERSSLRDKFTHIFETDLWSGRDSVSGAGASRDQTRILETELPSLLRKFEVEVLLDLPCGDFSWMQHVELPIARYIGGDIVPQLVEFNCEKYSRGDREFIELDLTSDRLPAADLLLCRDALVHLSYDDIFSALCNIQRSEINLLLTTTFPDCEQNVDIRSGDWRLLNLRKPPFNFPQPIHLLNEQCTEGNGEYGDKSLGLWKVEDLRVFTG